MEDALDGSYNSGDQAQMAKPIAAGFIIKSKAWSEILRKATL